MNADNFLLGRSFNILLSCDLISKMAVVEIGVVCDTCTLKYILERGPI